MPLSLGPPIRVLQRPLRCSLTRLFYDWKTRSDTIYALATSVEPSKGSPLAVIRVSGSRTSNVLRKIIEQAPSSSNSPNDQATKRALKPRHATLSRILDPHDKSLLDMGLVLWFPSPNSYTGEDSCEFHVHGSPAIIKKMLSSLGNFSGLRPAEPGEFTRRAVDNGKLDLVQAESLPELIAAQTDQQRRLSLQGLVGSTQRTYDRWTQALVRILAHLEASIDFGEDELIGEKRVVEECIQELSDLTSEITKFMSITSRCREVVRAGTRVSILGPPNAGKSTFMNILCQKDRSIVSDLSGTTRDVIEQTFELGGHTVTICDTAGLRDLKNQQDEVSADARLGLSRIEQHDAIEREGIKKALNNAKEANLIIYLVDGTNIHKEGIEATIDNLTAVLRTVDQKNEKTIHFIINKIDLARDICNSNRLNALLEDARGKRDIRTTYVSCRTNENIGALIGHITESLDNLQNRSQDLECLNRPIDYVNERHLALLGSTVRHLERAHTLDLTTIDEMAQHVRESVDYLSRITGSVKNDDVIDVIFRDFCIGK